jgi:hypothetical protein
LDEIWKLRLETSQREFEHRREIIVFIVFSFSSVDDVLFFFNTTYTPPPGKVVHCVIGSRDALKSGGRFRGRCDNSTMI